MSGEVSRGNGIGAGKEGVPDKHMTVALANTASILAEPWQKHLARKWARLHHPEDPIGVIGTWQHSGVFPIMQGNADI